ncbi:hypothetical protein AI19_11835 [Thalassolituus oleivorans 4BN06-13]|nr:hypothetical protein [Thalassolituus oleivorans 4BN06-13]
MLYNFIGTKNGYIIVKTWFITRSYLDCGSDKTFSTKTILFLYRWLNDRNSEVITGGLAEFSKSLGISPSAGRKAIEELKGIKLIHAEPRLFGGRDEYSLNETMLQELSRGAKATSVDIRSLVDWLLSNEKEKPSFVRNISKEKLGPTKCVLLATLLVNCDELGHVLGLSNKELGALSGIPGRSVKLYLKEFRLAGLVLISRGQPKCKGFGTTKSIIIIRMEIILTSTALEVFTLDRINYRNSFESFLGFEGSNKLKLDKYVATGCLATRVSQCSWKIDGDDRRITDISLIHMHYFDRLALVIASGLISKFVEDGPETRVERRVEKHFVNSAIQWLPELVMLVPKLPKVIDSGDSSGDPIEELLIKVQKELEVCLFDNVDVHIFNYEARALTLAIAIDILLHSIDIANSVHKILTKLPISSLKESSTNEEVESFCYRLGFLPGKDLQVFRWLKMQKGVSA